MKDDTMVSMIYQNAEELEESTDFRILAPSRGGPILPTHYTPTLSRHDPRDTGDCDRPHELCKVHNKRYFKWTVTNSNLVDFLEVKKLMWFLPSHMPSLCQESHCFYVLVCSACNTALILTKIYMFKRDIEITSMI